MLALGFRCYPNGFAYVVLTGNQSTPEIVAKDKFDLPQDECWCAKLCWLRRQIVELLELHNPDAVGIKRAESNVRKINTQRCEIEGVIKETIYSHSNVASEFYLKSQLRRDISGFTRSMRYLTSLLSERGLADLNRGYYQDAALVALAVLRG